MISELFKLVGKPYAEGYQDCYTLAQKYYLQQFNIQLTNYARPNNWHHVTGFNLFDRFFEAEGFQDTGNNAHNVKVGDALLINIARSACTNHVAIYVGQNKILHHLQGQNSKMEPYSDRWRFRVKRVLRTPAAHYGNDLTSLSSFYNQLPPTIKSRLKNEN